jgi:hypothetical protein
MGPSTLSTHVPYLGSEIHGPGTQVNANGRTQVHYGGNRTLGLKSMAQVLKPTLVAQVDANGRTQASSGGNCNLGLKSMAQVLKPTPVAQVDANGRTQAHSGGTGRLWSQS